MPDTLVNVMNENRLDVVLSVLPLKSYIAFCSI